MTNHLVIFEKHERKHVAQDIYYTKLCYIGLAINLPDNVS